MYLSHSRRNVHGCSVRFAPAAGGGSYIISNPACAHLRKGRAHLLERSAGGSGGRLAVTRRKSMCVAATLRSSSSRCALHEVARTLLGLLSSTQPLGMAQCRAA